MFGIIPSLLIVLLCITIFSSPAFAGAWVMEQGKWQVINTVSYYHSDERFDSFGNKIPQPTYSKREYNPYIEYGLLDHTTVGANLFLQDVSNSGQNNIGLSDAEFFARTQLWQERPKWKQSEIVVSIQPLIKLPAFGSSGQPMIGSSNMDVGISGLAGYSFYYFRQKTFAETELQYRYRFGQPKDQIRINSTLGQTITPEWQILAQSFTTLSADTVRGATFTQSPRDDYDLLQWQLTGVYHYNDQLSFQAGGYYNVAGRNIGNGIGALFAVWTRF